MKKNTIFISTLACFVLAAGLFSCSKSATTNLQEAQLCLNGATASDAMNCVSKIEDDKSPLAYSLRCSAIFISEGFGDAVDFVNALKSINNNSGGCGGGCSSTVSTLQAFRFASGDLSNAAVRTANNDKAALAFSNCAQADAKIYTQIASLFQLGTMTSMLAYATGGTNMTETDLQAQLTAGNLDDAVVGSIVSVTYATTCQDTTNASDSTKAYCQELSNSIKAGYTTTQIGDCIQKKIGNPLYVCP